MNDSFNKIITYLNGRDSEKIKVNNVEDNAGVSNTLPLLNQLVKAGICTKHDEFYLLSYEWTNIMKHLPREFENNPYGYFEDEQRKKTEFDATKKWYERENAKDIFENFPRVKQQANVAFWISILALLTTIILGVLRFVHI